MACHSIWRTIRRPFRYPSCKQCVWEVYDVGAAGCLKCGKLHSCASTTFQNSCPLVECDDHSRVCIITGQVVSEVRHAREEFTDTVLREEKGGIGCTDVDGEVYCIIYKILRGSHAKTYRDSENARQAKKLTIALHKTLRQHKVQGLKGWPCMLTCLAQVMATEKNVRFIQEASHGLMQQCVRQIVVCMLDLQSKGVKINSGTRLQNMACGLLYLLQTGLQFKNHMLLSCIEEVADCLPHENKLETFFGISSKVICETENEIKLVFREHFAAK